MGTALTHRFPNFIIGGAARSATTWLSFLADRHPDIAMAKPLRPEPKFFLVDELFARGLDYYAEKWFDSLPQCQLLGEKSTNYLESPNAADRIRRSLPDVRMIFMLRNPVDRAYSNYLWSRQNGMESESFDRAIALEEQREREYSGAMRYSRPYSYFSRGLYAEHLARYLRVFPRDRILVLCQEDMAPDPGIIASRFQRFLGVAIKPELASDLGIINAADSEGAEPLSPRTRAILGSRYREPNRQLQDLLGPDFQNWPEL